MRTARPIPTLAGRQERPHPVLFVTILGPTGAELKEALVDSGADDTVFPIDVASSIGLDLANAPTGWARGLGGGTALLRYAEVTLRLASTTERREWRAWVGFTAARMRRPVIGFAGFLQFFTTTLYGDREELELTANSKYPGT